MTIYPTCRLICTSTLILFSRILSVVAVPSHRSANVIEGDDICLLTRYEENVKNEIKKVLVDNYIDFHIKARNRGKKLVVKFDGDHPGLGDRISTILNCFVMASLSKRILLIDWQRPQQLSSFFETRVPLLLFNASTDEDRSAYHCREQCRSFDLRPLLGDRQTVYYYGTPLAHPLVLRQILFQFRTDSFIQSISDLVQNLPRCAHFYKDIFESVLRPRYEISQIVQKYSKIVKRGYLAIHARLGLGVGEVGGDRFSLGNKQTLKKLCHCFVDQTMATLKRLDPISTVYLATDTIEFQICFERQLQERDTNILVLSQRTRIGKPIHIKRCSKNFDRTCLQVLLDFVFLSKAAELIASPSSFSKMAYLTGGVSKRTILSARDCY